MIYYIIAILYVILKSNFKLFKFIVHLEAIMDLLAMWGTKLWQRTKTACHRALQEASQ